MQNIRLDAIPDLSDTQVIVYTKWDRSPDIIEDQVTYPIITALLGAPKVKAIRGFSDFGFSYVYVIFQDGTDIYWARSRVLEYLSEDLRATCRPASRRNSGPDATGVGWVFQYALVDKSGKHNLAELRTLPGLVSALRPAERARRGGGGRHRRLPEAVPGDHRSRDRLQSYGLSVMEVTDAIRKSNNEVGGRLIEWSGTRVHGAGPRLRPGHRRARQRWSSRRAGTARRCCCGTWPTIALGPQIRRGVSDLNGKGDTVGGIVVMRHGENALNVIKRVKAKLEELKPSLPEGVEIVTTYDRSELIQKSIDNLKEELMLEMIIVSLVILFFLWHIPSAIVPIITIPISVVLAFIPMYLHGHHLQHHEPGGHRHLHRRAGGRRHRRGGERLQEAGALAGGGPAGRLPQGPAGGAHGGGAVGVLLAAGDRRVVPAGLHAGGPGRAGCSSRWPTPRPWPSRWRRLLAVTLDPAVRMLFARMEPFRFRPRWLAWLLNALFVGKYYPEEKHPVSRVLFWLYEQPCRWVLRHPEDGHRAGRADRGHHRARLSEAGHEFMPPLNEGTILYMPTTLPGISVTEAQRLLETQDRILRSFPEVVSVFGKAGRADTSTDPAPFSMMETTVVLKPPDEWRAKTAGSSPRAPDRSAPSSATSGRNTSPGRN